MYELLRPRIGRLGALLVSALWYTALLLGILYGAFEPQAELKYLML